MTDAELLKLIGRRVEARLADTRSRLRTWADGTTGRTLPPEVPAARKAELRGRIDELAAIARLLGME